MAVVNQWRPTDIMGSDRRQNDPNHPHGCFDFEGEDAEELFRDLIEQSPDLVMCVAPSGTILYANPTTQRTLGYEASALAEMHFADLLADDTDLSFEQMARKLVGGDPVGPVELGVRDAQGKRLTVEAKINCRFEDGQPVWFRVVLRDLRAEADEATPIEEISDVEANLPPRILVVEDDPLAARMLARMLEHGGYVTERAATATEALEMLRNEHYDAMTLDLMLPDMDGAELLHQLRADEDTADLPVIVVSASADEAKERLTGDAAHVVDWLNKPFELDSLRSALTRAVQIDTDRMPRVLHVEDDREFAQHVRETLADVAQTDRAATLAEARRMLKDNEDYDLVLLDLTLPDGLGAELLPFLNRPRGRSVPVILVSASDATDALASHVADTLNKSQTTQQQMLETIRAHLHR